MGYADKDKQRNYLRTWIAARRKTFFTGKTCVKCGSGDNLELDHRDPTKKISHNIWSWTEVRRNEEISKCQILCRKCHRGKTNQELRTKMTGRARLSFRKLSEEDEQRILQLISIGHTHREIASMYSIGTATVNRIRYRMPA